MMTTLSQAKQQLLKAGFDCQGDGGGGYEIYQAQIRIGRVYSDQGRIGWQPPDAQPTIAPPWPEGRVLPLTRMLHGQRCWMVPESLAQGAPIYRAEPDLLALMESQFTAL
jgi:hypothetical protein